GSLKSCSTKPSSSPAPRAASARPRTPPSPPSENKAIAYAPWCANLTPGRAQRRPDREHEDRRDAESGQSELHRQTDGRGDGEAFPQTAAVLAGPRDREERRLDVVFVLAVEHVEHFSREREDTPSEEEHFV